MQKLFYLILKTWLGQPLNTIAHTDYEYERETDTRCTTVTIQPGNPRWTDER